MYTRIQALGVGGGVQGNKRIKSLANKHSESSEFNKLKTAYYIYIYSWISGGNGKWKVGCLSTGRKCISDAFHPFVVCLAPFQVLRPLTNSSACFDFVFCVTSQRKLTRSKQKPRALLKDISHPQSTRIFPLPTVPLDFPNNQQLQAL